MGNKSVQLADWTHKNVRITDIRSLCKLFVISIDDKEVTTPLFINNAIFEDRLYSYFLKNSFTREDVLSLEWNMYITKGYFIKITDASGKVERFEQDNKEKWFVSYFEVAGPLSTFSSVYKDQKNQK
jgi:hypothetical protein